MSVLIEVAVARVEDAILAQESGADRLELNTALELGGLTPSIGLAREVLSAVRIPVISMVRPRPAGFVHSPQEVRTMLTDADALLQAGVAGIAFGFLLPDRTVNAELTRDMVALIGPKESVFHRAFDLTPDPIAALDTLIAAGVTRILTSGQRPTAPEGSAVIARLISHAANRIQILPASGISPVNATSLIVSTRATQLHGTFSVSQTDPAMPISSDHYKALDPSILRQMKALADANMRNP